MIKDNLTPALTRNFQNFDGFHIGTYELVVYDLISLLWVASCKTNILFLKNITQQGTIYSCSKPTQF